MRSGGQWAYIITSAAPSSAVGCSSCLPIDSAMKTQLLNLLLGLVIAMNSAFANTRSAETVVRSTNVFWSGHSLTDPPIPEFVAEIAGGFGTSMQWNRHSMAGASLQARTRGRPPSETGWDGYRQGYNRNTENMDVIAELRTPRTVGGGKYDALVITDVHDMLWWIHRGDSVRLLRHYHERFLEGNPLGKTFFYEAWLGINDKDDPRSWIEYERAASPVWQCVATRVNTSLEFERRTDRIASLPAGLALATLVERATSKAGLAGISGASVRETLDRLFGDAVHLTRLGAYYVALVSYAIVSERSPIGAWRPVDIDPMQATQLQRVAADFVSNYQSTNRPLTLEKCSALVRDSFAETFWRYTNDGALAPGDSWMSAWLERTKHAVKRMRNIYNYRRAFADNSFENPFRFAPESDGTYWHPAP